MTSTLDISTLTLADVHHHLGLRRQVQESFRPWLDLAPLSEVEQRDLEGIAACFYSHYEAGKVAEGEVKFLTLAPLLWQAGYYREGYSISLEEHIASIVLDDGDTHLRGRMDILITTRQRHGVTTHPLWVLLIEAKNSEVNAISGLPQLLAYAFRSLNGQPATWGLATNGMTYQFVHLSAGTPSTYTLFPSLDLTRSDQAGQVLQVLKAVAIA